MHRFIPSSDNAAPSVASAEHRAAVKRWAREILRLPEETMVTLHETACADPGCPILECVIAVFDAPGRTRSWRFTRPRAALTKTMVAQTLATPPSAGG